MLDITELGQDESLPWCLEIFGVWFAADGSAPRLHGKIGERVVGLAVGELLASDSDWVLIGMDDKYAHFSSAKNRMRIHRVWREDSK